MLLRLLLLLLLLILGRTVGRKGTQWAYHGELDGGLEVVRVGRVAKSRVGS